MNIFRVGRLRVLTTDVSFCFQLGGEYPSHQFQRRCLFDGFPPVTPMKSENHSAEWAHSTRYFMNFSGYVIISYNHKAEMARSPFWYVEKDAVQTEKLLVIPITLHCSRKTCFKFVSPCCCSQRGVWSTLGLKVGLSCE